MHENVHSQSPNILDPVEKSSPETQSKDSVIMNGNADSPSPNIFDLERTSAGTRSCRVEDIGEKNEDCDFSLGAKSLGERVRKEVRDRFGPVGDEMLDEMFDEDDSAEVPILEEEEIIRGTRGVGALWKLALGATVSFATYILLSGPRFEPNWIPNFSERDPIPKIYLPKNRKK